MKKKIKPPVILIEFILFVAVFLYTIVACQGFDGIWRKVSWFIDIPSLTIILLLTIPGLIIMGGVERFCKGVFGGKETVFADGAEEH